MYDGYIFFCDKASLQQCVSNKKYTCVADGSKPTEPVNPGSLIFLYNTDDKTLLGPFTALTEDLEELDAGAWAEDIDEHIPSEDIKVTWEELHIIHDAQDKLEYLNNPKSCKISTTEVQRTLDLLKQGEPYLGSKEEKSNA